MQVGAQLVHDAPIAQRGGAYVPLLVMRERAAVAAVRERGPQIVGPVRIADEVQAAVPPHGAAVVGGFFIGCGLEQRLRLGVRA